MACLLAAGGLAVRQSLGSALIIRLPQRDLTEPRENPPVNGAAGRPPCFCRGLWHSAPAMMTAQQKHTFQILICLFLVYLSWGSCFISIRFALESFPPFLLCGLRMTMAGSLLYLVTRLRGERTRPTRSDWAQTLILAVFLVLISSGFLSKGQESVPSGTAAMISGSVPLWMVLGGWLILKEPRPSCFQFLGLAGGTAGLLLLSLHQGFSGETSFFGLFLLLLSALGWVVGSFYSKKHAGETRLSVMRISAMLMMTGGLQALAAGWLLGERFSPHDVTAASWMALAALVLLGAIVAYTCYFWLLLHTRTAVAVSYEYVNPVIGVFLGWLLAGERVDGVTVLACCMVVGSVFFVIAGRQGA